MEGKQPQEKDGARKKEERETKKERNRDMRG